MAAAETRRSSGSIPPWMIPKTAWSGRPRAASDRSRPPVGALHRLGDLGARQCWIHRLVECHGDVRPEQCLDLHRALGGQPMGRAVEVAGERHAVIVDPAEVRQAEDLEAAGIGQDRSVPGHEAMQPAQARDPLGGRTKVEVVRIPEDHLGTGVAQVPGRERLDGGLGADRHELRGLDDAVIGLDSPQPCAADTGRNERMGDRSGR